MQYYISTENPKFTLVLTWLGQHDIDYNVHLNRTRFHLDTSNKLHTEFMLLYSDCVGQVEEDTDKHTRPRC